MPAPIGPLFGFVFGVAFAWAAGSALARSRPTRPLGRAVALVLLFALAVFAPACAYFVAFEEDWAWLYLLDARRLPSAIDLALVLADVAAVLGGFFATLSIARQRRLLPLLATGAVPAAIAVATILWALPRLSTVATWAQFHGDFGTRAVAGSSLGWALLWMNGLVLAGAAWTARELRRLGRDRDQPPASIAD
jgi:hypothetical protein